MLALALRKDVDPLFPAQSDEVAVEEDEEGENEEAEDEAEEADSDDGEDDEPEYAVIDFDGLAERVMRAPIEADNYSALSAVEEHLLYIRGGPFFYGRDSGVKNNLMIFSLEDREESVLVEGAGGYALTPDGEKAIVAAGGGYHILDAAPGGGDGKKTIDTGDMMVEIDPRAEWRQIFAEVWRRYRDFFYVDNLHGYDWPALRMQYEPLLDHVAHRSDLNYVIGEMISELNVGHAYIAGGDREIPDRVSVALPGAEFELDEEAGKYRLTKIFHGHNEEPKYRAPLTTVGVDASQGDYVLAIDDQSLSADDNPYALLRGKADYPVTLTLSPNSDGSDSRDVTFEPVTDEANLVYLDWVEANRRKGRGRHRRQGRLHPHPQYER